MTPEEWRRIRAVLEPALEMPAANMGAWLDANCPPDIRAEVDALIAASDGPAFIDHPVAPHDMLLPPGAAIGPYTIHSSIGAGGMGVVYRAEDARLGRTVAIKLMPFSSRASMLLSEARMVSSLNHPNIVTLHDVVDHDGSLALVMELVDGVTLAELIGDGLAPDQALPIARQIVAALVASHDAGVLHRDLKPSNVMVRPDGTVKVLDFGIAQSTEAAAAGERPAGTAAYMAPEQAAGRPLDVRSDVYAFGMLLREMLAGRNSSANVHIPARWQRVIDRCVASDPDARFASMKDVNAALQPTAVMNRPAWWAAAAVIIASATMFVAWRSRATEAPGAGFDAQRLTGAPAAAEFPAISPDGARLAYSVVSGGASRLFVHGRNDMTPRDLHQEGRQPAWSPDGREIAFRSDRDGGGLFVLTLESSAIRQVTHHGYLPSWSPDGRQLAFSTSEFTRVEERPTTDSQLRVLDLASRVELAIALPELDAIQPAWSADGARLAFWSVDNGGRRRVWTVASGGGPTTAVTDGLSLDWDPVWSSDGWLYWVSDRSGAMNGWRARVDTASGRLLDAPQPVDLPATYAGFFSIAKDGALAYATRLPISSIWRMNLDPVGAPIRITPPALRVRYPSVSPDGKWIVAFEQERAENLVVFRTDGSDLRRLTTGEVRDRGPSWSPDGQRIAFGSNRGGDYQIWTVRPDGTDVKLFVANPAGAFSPVWSPSGDRLAWFARGFIPFVSGAAGQTALPQPGPNEGFRPTDWAGDSIAGLIRTADGGRLATAVYSMTTGRYTRVNQLCEWVRWMPGTADLICAEGRRLSLIDPSTGRLTELAMLPDDISNQFAVSADGKTIYLSLAENQVEIWTAVRR